MVREKESESEGRREEREGKAHRQRRPHWRPPWEDENLRQTACDTPFVEREEERMVLVGEKGRVNLLENP